MELTDAQKLDNSVRVLYCDIDHGIFKFWKQTLLTDTVYTREDFYYNLNLIENQVKGFLELYSNSLEYFSDSVEDCGGFFKGDRVLSYHGQLIEKLGYETLQYLEHHPYNFLRTIDKHIKDS